MNNLIKHVCKRCLLFKYLDSSSLILAFEGGFSERFGTYQIPFGFVLCEVKKKAIKSCAIYLAFINYLLVLPLNLIYRLMGLCSMSSHFSWLGFSILTLLPFSFAGAYQPTQRRCPNNSEVHIRVYRKSELLGLQSNSTSIEQTS